MYVCIHTYDSDMLLYFWNFCISRNLEFQCFLKSGIPEILKFLKTMNIEILKSQNLIYVYMFSCRQKSMSLSLCLSLSNIHEASFLCAYMMYDSRHVWACMYI